MAKSEKNWIYKCKFAKYALFSNFLGGGQRPWKFGKNMPIFSKFPYFQRAGNIVGNLEKQVYFFQISILPTGGK